MTLKVTLKTNNFMSVKNKFLNTDKLIKKCTPTDRYEYLVVDVDKIFQNEIPRREWDLMERYYGTWWRFLFLVSVRRRTMGCDAMIQLVILWAFRHLG